MADNDEMVKKRELVTRKLHERESERLAEIDKREIDKEANKSEHEQVQTFHQILNREKEEIENALSTTNGLNKQEILDHLDSLTKRCQKLQKYVSDSTIFLPSYNLRKAQGIVSALITSVTQTQDSLVPPKKFAFKKRTKASIDVKSKASSEEQSGDINKNVNVVPVDCGFTNLSGQSLQMIGHEITAKDVSLDSLVDCTVKLEGSSSTVHITRLTQCKVFIGPVATSVFIENCKDCQFVLAAQQLRVHATTDSSFYIHVTSRAIIEDCNNLGFGSYNWSYPLIQEHYKLSGLNQDVNNWDNVADFNWLSSDQPSPNWFIIKDSVSEG